MGSRAGAALVACLLVAAQVPAQPKTLVRMVVSPPGQVIVGQKVPFRIDVLTTGRFDRSPVFDIPTTPGALVLRLPGRPTFGSEEVEGTAYSTYRFEFAFYAQRAGQHAIPEIRVRGSVAAGFGETAVPFSLVTEKAAVEAVLPPGAERLRTLVATPEFEVEEHWDPAANRVVVGDTLTRRVRMAAKDVMGMAIPRIASDEIDGLRAYAKPPRVSDSSERGEIRGTLEQEWVYVCERVGRFRVPETKVVWFDLEANAMRSQSIGGRDVVVDVSPRWIAEEEAERSERGWWILAPVLLFGVLVTCGVWNRTRIRTWWRRYRDRDAVWIARIRAACRSNRPHEVLTLLWGALDRPVASPRVPTAVGWAQLHGPELVREVEVLERAIVYRDSWSGKDLLRCLPKKLFPSRMSDSFGLGKLNPGMDVDPSRSSVAPRSD